MQVSRTRSPRWPVITAIFDPESSAAWKAYLSETQWTVHFEKAIMCEKWQKVWIKTILRSLQFMIKKKLDSKQLIASLSEIIPNIFALEKWVL